MPLQGSGIRGPTHGEEPAGGLGTVSGGVKTTLMQANVSGTGIGGFFVIIVTCGKQNTKRVVCKLP